MLYIPFNIQQYSFRFSFSVRSVAGLFSFLFKLQSSIGLIDVRVAYDNTNTAYKF